MNDPGIYKDNTVGASLISVLIGCIAYNSFYEWQEIEALELDNLSSNQRSERQYYPTEQLMTKQCHQKNDSTQSIDWIVLPLKD